MFIFLFGVSLFLIFEYLYVCRWFDLDLISSVCFSKYATWEKVEIGKEHGYGPPLGVHFGFVDENGRHASKINGGIKDEKKPQLAKNSVWKEAVKNSLIIAEAEG